MSCYHTTIDKMEKMVNNNNIKHHKRLDIMSERSIVCIIPARYGSSRFPGKPLAKIAGKSMICRVYDKVKEVLDEVYVATDDERIAEEVKTFGGKAIMTSPTHQSGTDRIYEAYQKIGKSFDVVINVQGDEPFLNPSSIRLLCDCFKHDLTDIATLGIPFKDIESAKSPNSPKIVMDNQHFALYFSRSVIPFVRDLPQELWLSHTVFLKHIGIYGYRSEILKTVTAMEMSTLEKAEGLEQLRWLQNGYKIMVAQTEHETIGIDTPEDLVRAEEWIRQGIIR